MAPLNVVRGASCGGEDVTLVEGSQRFLDEPSARSTPGQVRYLELLHVQGVPRRKIARAAIRVEILHSLTLHRVASRLLPERASARRLRCGRIDERPRCVRLGAVLRRGYIRWSSVVRSPFASRRQEQRVARCLRWSRCPNLV